MRGGLGILIAVGFAAASLLVPGCARDGDDQKAGQGPNVLLIAVDTLRADRLGCYGSDLGATPRLDALAAEGVRFKRAFSHAP